MPLLDPYDERQALNLGFLSAGLGILGNNYGNFGAFAPAVGRGGLMGLNTYMGARDQFGQDKLRGLQAQQAQGALDMQGLQMKELQRQIQEREQYQKLLTGSGMGPGAKPLTPPQPQPMQQPAVYQDGKFVSQPDQAQVTDNMRATFAQSLVSRGRQLVDAGMGAGNIQAYEMGLKLMEQGTKFMPEVHKVEDAMQGGKPIQVMYFKDGTHAVVPGISPKPNYQQVNTGQQQFFVDPLTGNRSPAGAFLTQMTPGERARLDADKMPKPADIRKELHATKEYQNWVVVRPVTEAARKAVKIDNAAADLDIIYAVAKQVDPDSVVREGETAMVVKTGSPAQQFLGTWNFVTGGGRLTQEQRGQLMRIIEDRGQAHYNNFLRAYEPYKHSIEKYKLDPREIVDEKVFEFGKPEKPAAAQGQTPPMLPGGKIDTKRLAKNETYVVGGKAYKWNGMEFVAP